MKRLRRMVTTRHPTRPNLCQKKSNLNNPPSLSNALNVKVMDTLLLSVPTKKKRANVRFLMCLGKRIQMKKRVSLNLLIMILKTTLLSWLCLLSLLYKVHLIRSLSLMTIQILIIFLMMTRTRKLHTRNCYKISYICQRSVRKEH